MISVVNSLFDLLRRASELPTLDKRILADIQNWLTDACRSLDYPTNADGFNRTYQSIHTHLWSDVGIGHLYAPKTAFDGLSIEDIRKRVAGLIVGILAIKTSLDFSEVAQKIMDIMEANDYFPNEVRE